MSSEHRRQLGSASTYALVAAVQRGLPFLVLLAVAGATSPSEYGQLAILASIFALAQTTLSLGQETVSFRAWFGPPSTRDSALASAAWMAAIAPILVCGAFIAILSISGSTLFGIDAYTMTLTIGGAALAASGSTVPLAVMRARERITAYAAAIVASIVFSSSLKTYLVFAQNLGTVGWALGDVAYGVSISLLCAPTHLRLLGKAASIQGVLNSARVGLPLVPHVAASWVLNLSNRFIIAALISTAAAGIFSYAYQLAMIPMILITEYNRAVLPIYGRHRQASDSDQLKAAVALQRIVTAATFLIGAVGGIIWMQLFGPVEYRSATELVPFICVGLLAYGLYYIPMNFLSIVEGRTAHVGLFTVLCAGLSVALNILLIPLLGISGAAVSTVISYSALLAVITWHAGRRRPAQWTPLAGVVVGAVAIALGAFTVAGTFTWI